MAWIFSPFTGTFEFFTVSGSAPEIPTSTVGSPIGLLLALTFEEPTSTSGSPMGLLLTLTH